MASTLDIQTTNQRQELHEETVVAVVEAVELEAAKKDPRVRTFLEEADAYLAEFEQHGRSR